jgi:hypothetical protein
MQRSLIVSNLPERISSFKVHALGLKRVKNAANKQSYTILRE